MDIEAVTAKTAEDAKRFMRQVGKDEYWSPKMVRAYNMADCTSITVTADTGTTYRVSLSSIGDVFDVVQVNPDGSEHFYRR